MRKITVLGLAFGIPPTIAMLMIFRGIRTSGVICAVEPNPVIMYTEIGLMIMTLFLIVLALLTEDKRD